MTGTSPYEAPIEFERQKGSTAQTFNVSAIEGKELWLLRIPDNLSLKELDGLTIKNPKSAKNGIVGKLTSGSNTFQIISSIGESTSEFKAMAEMNLLVPDDDDDEKSTLSLLPNRCTKMFSIVEDVKIPDSTKHAQEILDREPPVRAQPENMKMRFIPFGFYSAEEYRDMANGKSEEISLADDPVAVNASAAPETPKKRKKSKNEAASNDMDVDAEGDSSKKAKKEKKDKKKKKKSKTPKE
ncbi:DNA-directed RNA polymerase I, subunit RPA34.5 [Coemansia mojavensis]|nr:DNA-directed RNA polymerase I, subunit RPA34.5 [Coemansia mojavensis]